jgi:hypothetical protein
MDVKGRIKITGGVTAILCVLVFVHFLDRPADAVLSLEFSSSVDSYAQLYYDSGRGFDEAHSTKENIKATPHGVFKHLQFHFRARRLRGLRFDPAIVAGRFVLRDVRLQVAGRDLFTILPNGIRPLHELSNCSLGGNSMWCDTMREASDPQLSLQLPHPLGRWQMMSHAYGRPITETTALLIFLGAGAVLATSDKAMAWMRQPSATAGRHPLVPLPFFCLVTIAFLLLALRRPDALVNPQLWAEDGVIFFREDLQFGFWHSLITPYAGYLHAIPRLIAGLTSNLPARFVPVSFSVAALSVEALSCSAFFLPCCRAYIQSDAIRAAACIALACVVPTGHELVGTISNVQWWLLIPGLLLMVSRPDHKRGWQIWAAGLMGMLIALSSALLVIGVPLVAANSALKRKLPPIPAAITCIGAVIQGAVGMTETGAPSPAGVDLLSTMKAVAAAWLSRPMLQMFFGEAFVRSASDGELTGWMVAALCITVAGLVSLILLLGRADRLKVFGAIYVAGASLGLVMVGRNFVQSFLTQDGWRNFLGQRYFFLPSVILIFLVAIAVQRSCGRRLFLGALVLLAVFATGIYHNFPSPAFADLRWPEYTSRIDAWRKAKTNGQSVQPFEVPINPQPWALRFD